MRNAFAKELVELAAADSRVVLLSGDIGNRMFDDYKDQFPNRFYNCGVAEANMMGMAAGLAICGMRPVVYTIVPFVTTRCLEQIRVDVCYHQAPVVIVGVGGGLCYASLGATHHSCEDIALLRMLPEMTVLCPGDPTEVQLCLAAALHHPGPVYIRLGKKGEPAVHEKPPAFKIGKGIQVQTGQDIALLSTGNMLTDVQDCAKNLESQDLSCRVISMPTVKPLDEEALRDVFQRTRLVVTIEEHSVQGGLGGAVAEWLADSPRQQARLLRIGTPDKFLHQVCDQDQARRLWGLEAGQMAGRILRFYREIKESALA